MSVRSFLLVMIKFTFASSHAKMITFCRSSPIVSHNNHSIKYRGAFWKTSQSRAYDANKFSPYFLVICRAPSASAGRPSSRSSCTINQESITMSETRNQLRCITISTNPRTSDQSTDLHMGSARRTLTYKVLIIVVQWFSNWAAELRFGGSQEALTATDKMWCKYSHNSRLCVDSEKSVKKVTTTLRFGSCSRIMIQLELREFEVEDCGPLPNPEQEKRRQGPYTEWALNWM